MAASCNSIHCHCFGGVFLKRNVLVEYLTIKETAEKWNISERRIQILCREGRIDGIVKFGRAWAIPINAKKPDDARIKSGAYVGWRKKTKNSGDY